MKQAFNVFCLPFAGGNKYSYRDFKSRSPEFLNLILLEYPGRGARTAEPLITDVKMLVNDLYEQIKELVQENDYAIYGHSMGGLLAYLLAVKLAEEGKKKPLHLFITGTVGPSAPSRGERKRFQMPQNEFFQELREFGGMPAEVLDNMELLYYLEPILRADFQASESYIYSPNPILNIPATVITGIGEDIEQADIEIWQNEFSDKVDFRRLPGKHFFIFDYIHEIILIIAKKLATLKNVNYYERTESLS